jgi:hypothetical protein
MPANNVNKNTASSTAIIAAQSGKVIRILGLQLIAAGDVTVTIEDEDGTDLIGPMALCATGGFCFVPIPDDLVYDRCYQQAPSGKAVHLLLSAAVQVGGAIQYSVR